MKGNLILFPGHFLFSNLLLNLFIHFNVFFLKFQQQSKFYANYVNKFGVYCIVNIMIMLLPHGKHFKC